VKTPAFWSREAGLLAWALSPLAWLYGVATVWRMSARGQQADIPVICIGNLTAGGAGKTPATMMLAEALEAVGERPFIISRGYGGREPGPVRVNPETMRAGDIGDEPLLMAQRISVIVARDRRQGAALAYDLGATVVLLDDGLQNPALSKDFTLAVIDAGAMFGNGFCLPAGPLRAPVGLQMRFVDAVLCVGNAEETETTVAILARWEKPAAHGTLVPSADAINALRGRALLAFAGIGRPEKFFQTLRDAGLSVAATRTFADHHPYSEADIAALEADAARAGHTLVTTQKDSMRIPGIGGRAQVLPVSLELRDHALIDLVKAAIARRRSEN
jgi:tetraacyldisaccharide 4'-kinase